MQNSSAGDRLENDVRKIELMVGEMLEQGDIKEFGVITQSGSPVSMRLSGDKNPNFFAVMCATVFGAATSLVEGNGSGQTIEISIKNGSDEMKIKRIGKKTLLAVVKDNKG